jgi:hypothetical protein
VTEMHENFSFNEINKFIPLNCMLCFRTVNNGKENSLSQWNCEFTAEGANIHSNLRPVFILISLF